MTKRREGSPKKRTASSTEQPRQSPRAELTASSSEPRDRERVPILGELRGEVMVFQALTILDISSGGAQVETTFPLQLDSLHDFRLTLGDHSVVVKARIAHCHVGDLDEERVGYRTGVEFIDPPEHARKAIAAFIESLRAQRGR